MKNKRYQVWWEKNRDVMILVALSIFIAVVGMISINQYMKIVSRLIFDTKKETIIRTDNHINRNIEKIQ